MLYYDQAFSSLFKNGEEESLSVKYNNIVTEAKELMESWGNGWPVISTDEYASVPFFGKVLKQVRDVNGKQEEYYNILRHFGWSVAFGVTMLKEVPTLIQWKPGVNKGSWELPPGGIGKIAEEASLETILERTKEVYQRETGYGGGIWTYLGHIMIETGKYRGATADSHGLEAHLWLAESLKKVGEFKHAPEEKIRLLQVRLNDFRDVLDCGLFVEESAVACAYKALLKLGHLSWS